MNPESAASKGKEEKQEKKAKEIRLWLCQNSFTIL
jgi:hypothetical protein